MVSEPLVSEPLVIARVSERRAGVKTPVIKPVKVAYSPAVYQALLTRRYLTSKVMPLLASLAVVLCTAMVLITWSVMGGFLTALTQSGRTLIGDVRISWPNIGFAYYDDLINRLQDDPMVGAASPVIETFGMLTMPDNRTDGVLIRGIDAASFAKVTNYAQTLWWKPLDKPMKKDRKAEDIRLKPEYRAMFAKLYQDGLTLHEKDPQTGELEPAMVLGIEVGKWNSRTKFGAYVPWEQAKLNPDGSVVSVDTFVPRDASLALRVIPLDRQGRPLEVVTRVLPVANEFESGLYDVDSKTVLVDLAVLQRMLHLNKAKRLADKADFEPLAFDNPDEAQPKVVQDPARVTAVLVSLATRSTNNNEDQKAVDALKARCATIYADFAAAHAGQVPAAGSIQIDTWEDANRMMIAAVEKETGLVLVIFSFISLTAVFLVFAIFWAMVSEKTKDIGVLRALGASRLGVAWIWLRYGLAIGVVGSIFGGLLAWVIVTNINEIHTAIAMAGQTIGKTLVGHPWNWYIWDPSVYVFKEIPHHVEPWKAAFVLTGGLISCLCGALFPALRAARMNPVEALRFE